MKKLTAILAAVLILNSTALADTRMLYVNGIPAWFETENIYGYTYVDYKLFCTAINAAYAYKAEQKKITVVRDGYVLDMFIDSGDICMNGTRITTEAAPYIDSDGAVMVPLANLCRGIGMTVYYDEEKDKIIVNKTSREAGTATDNLMTDDRAPVIDFTDKSEDMIRLHIETRRDFERYALPLYFLDGEIDAADLLRTDSLSLMDGIDEVWSNCAVTSIIGYGVDIGYDFGSCSMGDYASMVNEYAVEFSLEPYDCYTLSREIFPDGRYLLMVELADLEVEGVCCYTMIFLEGDEFSYYTAEKTETGIKVLEISLDEDGELVYSELGEIENSKLEMMNLINTKASSEP